jgi:predicted metal-dependent enzyme (double-stranded beta helix superfamily)
MNADRRPVGLPGPSLNSVELLDYTRFIAAEVRARRYFVEYDEVRRWHQRLYRDQRVDVWLISWLPSQGTQLHDHGGSAGAFTVLSGELAEAIYQPGSAPGRQPAGRSAGPALVERRRASGSGAGFGPHYVHDVRNVSRAPAVSVHAYSPPLTSMSFYDLHESGALRMLAKVATEDPEPVLQLNPTGDGMSEPAA